MEDADLLLAYERTSFRVDDGTTRFAIRIGETCPELDDVLAQRDARDWAYVTACNPGSRPLSVEENQSRQAALEERVLAEGWPFLRGRGVPADSDWEPEDSLLIIGMPLEAACALGRAFGQRAIVTGRAGALATLTWLETG